MYKLVTERMYLTLSNPRLAKEVADFHQRNREAHAEFEPARPASYYDRTGIRRLLKMDYRDAMNGSEFRFYLTPKGEKTVIGTVCIGSVLFGSVKSCTLSYKIDKDWQGQGYCSERVEEIINFAFNTLRLHRIERLVMPRNEKSLAIMRKFGFVQEGLQRQCLEVNNRWEDHLQFALLNDEISPVQNYDR